VSFLVVFLLKRSVLVCKSGLETFKKVNDGPKDILHRVWCRLLSFSSFKTVCFYELIGSVSREKLQKKIDSFADKVSS
jgi:hypothetical protein